MKPQVLFILDHELRRCVRLKNHIAELAHDNVDCHVVEFQYTGFQPIKLIKKDEVSIYTVFLPSFVHHFRTLSAELPFFRWIVARSLKAIKTQWNLNPAVIHCYNTFAWQGVSQFARQIPRVHLTVDFAEDLPSIMREYDYVKRGIGKVLVSLKQWELLQADAVKNADTCLVVTEEAANDYVHRYGVNTSKFIPINNLPSKDLVEKARSTSKTETESFSLLYFGDTSMRRGTDLLIRTAPKIKMMIPEYEVIIIGHNNREQPRLNEMVEEYECGDYVRLLGFQPESELPTYMAMADIGASPLKRNPHHDTTHANKLFQFMLGGLPLIVSDCTAQANLISDYELGVVFEADKDSSFIQAIQQVYSNEGLRATWGQNAKSYLSELSLQKAVSPYARLIHMLQRQ